MRHGRCGLLALAMVLILAGCGAVAGQPSPSPPTGHRVALPAEFQGQWDGHGRHLTVKGDGTAAMFYRTYQWCTATQTTGCDQLTGGSIVDGGHDEMVFNAVANMVASGTVTKSTTPRLVGSAVTFTLHVDGTAALHQAKQADALWTFCGANAVNIQSYCGA